MKKRIIAVEIKKSSKNHSFINAKTHMSTTKNIMKVKLINAQYNDSCAFLIWNRLLITSSKVADFGELLFWLNERLRLKQDENW